MPTLYCPQCGRGLDLESSEVRFCRFCGFELADTSDAVRGYSEQKRKGFAVVTWSYAVLLIVTLLLHGGYIPTETRWGYWLSALCIVASVSFFVSASLSALKPAVFMKAKRRGAESDATHRARVNVLENQRRAGTLPPSPGVPVMDLSSRDKRTVEVMEPRTVAEGTTKKLDK